MTLTELRYIVAVAQERHFGRAARRCFVSQPTLSIAIKKLEEELAVSLFDRSSNDIITTEAGERIVAQARKVLEEAELIRHLANEEQNELEGAFKLGLIFTVAPYLLPKLIVSLRRTAPKMPLSWKRITRIL
ncbi:bacterial regulatory helix-turn-helix, lysR family protein [Neisseria meningitidis NM94]|nr:bacterial regulatory helix-turn-helix, lysR family protein [Neisseria meningitidis NM94]